MPVSCQGVSRPRGASRPGRGVSRPRERLSRPRGASGPGRVFLGPGFLGPGRRQAPLGLEVTRVYDLSTVVCDVPSCDTQVHLHIQKISHNS